MVRLLKKCYLFFSIQFAIREIQNGLVHDIIGWGSALGHSDAELEWFHWCNSPSPEAVAKTSAIEIRTGGFEKCKQNYIKIFFTWCWVAESVLLYWNVSYITTKTAWIWSTLKREGTQRWLSPEGYDQINAICFFKKISAVFIVLTHSVYSSALSREMDRLVLSVQKISYAYGFSMNFPE